MTGFNSMDRPILWTGFNSVVMVQSVVRVQYCGQGSIQGFDVNYTHGNNSNVVLLKTKCLKILETLLRRAYFFIAFVELPLKI